MNKPILYVMVGLMGSGKSTYANILKTEKNAVLHSSDDLRMEMFGTYDCMDKNDEVFNELYLRINRDLANGTNVIYDATNITYKSRRKMFNAITLKREQYDCIAVVMTTLYEDCILNNLKRQRKVPEEVIKRAYMNFQMPMYFEFDKIMLKNASSYENVTARSYKNIMTAYNYNQENKYHTLTLDNHCFTTSTKLAESKKELGSFGIIGFYTVFLSALYHDYGKLYTKTYDEEGNAHYYCHENVGAYEHISTLTCNEQSDFRTVRVILSTQLINWHMKPYTWINDKTHNKYKKMLGEDFYSALMALHQADRSAH